MKRQQLILELEPLARKLVPLASARQTEAADFLDTALAFARGLKDSSQVMTASPSPAVVFGHYGPAAGVCYDVVRLAWVAEESLDIIAGNVKQEMAAILSANAAHWTPSADQVLWKSIDTCNNDLHELKIARDAAHSAYLAMSDGHAINSTIGIESRTIIAQACAALDKALGVLNTELENVNRRKDELECRLQG